MGIMGQFLFYLGSGDTFLYLVLLIELTQMPS